MPWNPKTRLLAALPLIAALGACDNAAPAEYGLQDEQSSRCMSVDVDDPLARELQPCESNPGVSCNALCGVTDVWGTPQYLCRMGTRADGTTRWARHPTQAMDEPFDDEPLEFACEAFTVDEILYTGEGYYVCQDDGTWFNDY